MIAFWTILHGIAAIALVGAVTHQGLAVWRRPAPARLFVDRFRAVKADGFVNAVVSLYLLTFALGALIYPGFVLHAKAEVLAYSSNAMGMFQIKEHVAVIGLSLLPLYWHYWRTVPLNMAVDTRRFLTTSLMIAVWWNLVVGHIANNVRGLL